MAKKKRIDRIRIIGALVAAIEPLDYVHALWEGGAVAFNRVDRWSDIDICVDAEDERVEEVFQVAECALESLAPIEVKYEVPPSTLHGYVQAFYRLKGTSKFMLVDLAIFKHSTADKLLEPEVHGRALFHFNKNNIVKLPRLNRERFVAALKTRLERIQKRYEIFGCFIPKEINRENYIEALEFYYKITLDSLVEVLRIKYKPVRYNFKTRYIRYDLPPAVLSNLKDFYFIRDGKDLRERHQSAERWFYDTIKRIDFAEIEKALDD